MSEELQKADGHQISHEVLRRAIAIDKNCNVEDVEVQEMSKAQGSNKGENFTCVLFALDIKATVNGKMESFHYMAKCLPANEYRAKFLNEFNGFSRECYVYDSLMKAYQNIRKSHGLRELQIPKVLITNEDEGIIIMENLKAQGFTMMNRVTEELSYNLASLVLKEAASFHATGYQFLQKYPGGLQGFLKEHPEMNYPGWLGNGEAESGRQMNEMMTGMAMGILGILQAHGNDKDLEERMQRFIPDLAQVLNDKTQSKSHYKFQTINHNDLHMNNVMYKKVGEDQFEDLTFLDLQVMKYTRPTVDLAYFFGSSSFASFRRKHLNGLLQVYHQKLTEELSTFGYSDLYSFDDLVQDFEDTWGFGFIATCLHIQILNMDFDGPDGYDPDKMTDEESHKEMMQSMAKLQIERAGKNKPYLEKVFGVVKEAAEKNII